jgi:hypothetical protein
MTKRTPSAERLYRARKAAAKELKLPVTDWRCKRYALLMCAHDNVTARLANGADINVDALLRLDAAMAEVRSSVPQEPIKVVVEVVDPLPPSESPPSSPPSSPPPTESKPSPPAPSAPQPQGNVVPIRNNSLPRRSGEQSETWSAWLRTQNYGRAPDGGLGRGNPSRGGLIW